MVVVKKPKQNTNFKECPVCGSHNLVAISTGTMCKDCKAIQEGTAPIVKGILHKG